MSGGSTTVGSGLRDDQKHIISSLGQLLLGSDPTKPFGPAQTTAAVNKLMTPAPKYNGNLVAKTNGGYINNAQQGQGMNAQEAYNQSNQALQPLLNGQQAYAFQPLQGNQNLNIAPVQATGALNPTNPGYNYQTQNVKSDLDNSQFTQDYFNLGVKDPLMATYKNTIAPQLTDAGASNGNTFSTRTTYAKGQALQGLQTQMAAQLSTAARQDNIERSQQDLAAQQFNSSQGQQNAQFGSTQGLNYAQLGSQTALGLAGLNSQNQIAQAQVNNQDNQFYDQFNNNMQYQLGTDAMNRRLSGVQASNQSQGQFFGDLLAKNQLIQPIQQNKQATVNADYNEWLRTQPQNSPWLQLALGTAGLNPQSIVSQSRSPTDYIYAGAAGLNAASQAGLIGGATAGGLAASTGLFAGGSAAAGAAAAGTYAGTAAAAGGAAGGVESMAALASLFAW